MSSADTEVFQTDSIDRIITDREEKWILDNNVKRKRQWLSRGSKPIPHPRSGPHPKNSSSKLTELHEEGIRRLMHFAKTRSVNAQALISNNYDLATATAVKSTNKSHVLIETIPPSRIVHFANIIHKTFHNPFDDLKAAILQHTEPSAVERVEKLLQQECVGESRPTAWMKLLAPGESFHSDFLKSSFLNNTPTEHAACRGKYSRN
ncbi:hypothetical protein ACTXT7_016243 [Hymenolepis weldensis]